jgi:DNA topoisomerase-6 subunit B
MAQRLRKTGNAKPARKSGAPRSPSRAAGGRKKKKDRQLGLFETAVAPEKVLRRADAARAAQGAEAAPEPAPAETVPTAPEPAVAEPAEKQPSPTRRSRAKERSAAEILAVAQREISVSEFFTKNRHLLGFDNPQKALLTAVKEAVDNSLDACEEARILPEIEVIIQELAENRFRVRITDNGPGIIHSQIPRVFGKLLYGSKFHRLRQSRGQQGIGISAAGMYAQLTTGKPVCITSRTRADRPAHRLEIRIDTRKNEPERVRDEKDVPWDAPFPTGTRVELEIEALYRAGRRSVDQYIEQTAIANPHATIHYQSPKGERITFERLTGDLPPEPLSIKPHPHGVELGALGMILKDTRARDLRGMLMREFSRVSDRVAQAMLEVAGLRPEAKPRSLKPDDIERLHRALSQVKVMSPPAACVVPIGEELILKGLQKGVQADFVTSTTRPPAVYRGNPFIVEAGLAWGGNLPGEELASLFRFANRVPLQYQQSDCAITKAVMDTDWRNYRVQQARGALPTGPLVIMVHVASVWVPFTSESKEAVARYPEILREIRLALQTCGRRLAVHLSQRRREAEEGRKRSYIETYIPHIGIALKEMLRLDEKQERKVVETLTDTLRRSRASV